MLKTLSGSSFTIPTIHQYSPIRARLPIEEPDTPDSVRRSTEERALRQIAQCAHYLYLAHGRTRLTSVHLELLRLERGAMQFLPQLTHDERIEFIIAAARLRDVSPRQLEGILDQASDILMWRELRGLDTAIQDLTEHEIKRLYRSTTGYRPRKSRLADSRRGRIAQAAVA